MSPFPFGYGLSYTTFDLAAPQLSEDDGTYRVTTRVTNNGDVAGAEVVQVYLGIPAEGQPPKRLVGFQKVSLQPGESQSVAIVIDPEANNHPLAVYDKTAKQFVNRTGTYTLYVGNSSSPGDLKTLRFERGVD